MDPIAPTEADSVGVAMPVRIEPSTKIISERGGRRANITFFGSCFFWLSESLIDGHDSGLIIDKIIIQEI